MKKRYIIQDMVQPDENNRPFIWYGNYTNKQFTTDISEAKYFDSLEDAEMTMEEILRQFDGQYQIITTYSL